VTDSGQAERYYERRDVLVVNLLLDQNRPRLNHQRLSSAAEPILKRHVVYLPFLAHGLSEQERTLVGLPLVLRVQASLLHRPRLQRALRMQAGLPREDTRGDLVVR
jgi:hypothetical protein